MPSPKKLLKEFEGFAKKKFGQHFLCSDGIIANIVGAAEITATDNVLEIGPGLGALTDSLIALENRYRAYEIDTDMIQFLKYRHPNIDIRERDASKVNWEEELDGKWLCVSNLPYNVGTTMVTNMLGHPDLFSRLTVMLQREVALRMLAPVHDRKRGSLSVYCQLLSDVKSVLRVPPGAFFPPPKVDSSVINLTLRRHPSLLLYPMAWSSIERTIRLGFSHPRKTIRNNLKKSFSDAVLIQSFEEVGISPRLRPANIENDEWVRLSKALEING